MSLLDTLKSLFVSGTSESNSDTTHAPNAKPEDCIEYKNCLISPAPIKEGSQYRTAGSISNQSADNPRETQFIRADNHTSREQAVEHCITKAKQIINERGNTLFDSERC